jgi:cytochrome P450 family 6
MLTAICLLGVTLWLVYKLWTSNFGYWKERGFPYLEATFPWGTMKEASLLSKYNGTVFQELYNKLEGEAYGGIHLMRRPVLLVRDPQVTSDNYSHFLHSLHVPICKFFF